MRKKRAREENVAVAMTPVLPWQCLQRELIQTTPASHNEFTPQISAYYTLNDGLKALKSLYTNSFPSLQYILLKDYCISYTNAFVTPIILWYNPGTITICL